MVENKQRSCNLDLIRVFALLTVVSVHFFWDGTFYDQVIDSPYMVFPLCVRNFSMICVPLFLMLSGYLLKNRKPCKSYYCKLFQTVGIYLLSSIAYCILVYCLRREEFSLGKAIRGIFAFETLSYAWYIEMYIGLFLMIPFFNMAYGNCSDKGKKLLVITALILTALPSLLNIWRPHDLSWWLRPGSSNEYFEIAPDQWEAMHFFTFYFIGAYLRDFPLKLKPLPTLLLAVGVCLVGGVFTYYRCYGYIFAGWAWTSYQSVLTTVQSVLVFHFLNSLDLSKLGNGWKKLLKKLSSWVLGAYLCSSFFDEYFYPQLVEAQPVFLRSFLYYPVMVAAVAVCSIAVSVPVTEFYHLCEGLVVKWCRRREEKVS